MKKKIISIMFFISSCYTGLYPDSVKAMFQNPLQQFSDNNEEEETILETAISSEELEAFNNRKSEIANTIEQALRIMSKTNSVDEGFLDLFIDTTNVTKELMICRLVGEDAFPDSYADEAKAKKIVNFKKRNFSDLNTILCNLKRSGRDDLFIDEAKACLIATLDSEKLDFFTESIYHLNLFFLLRSIRSIEFSSKVKNIDSDTLCIFPNLREIIFENGSRLKNIPKYMCRNCYKLHRVIFSNNVRSIGKGVFENCYSLREIGHKENKKIKIRGRRGRQTTQIIKSGFPQTLISLGAESFKNCRSLTNLDLSNTNIPSIQEKVFDGCSLLQDLLLPHSVEIILSPIEGCESLAFIQAFDIDREELVVSEFVTAPVIVKSEEESELNEQKFSIIANGLFPHQIIALSELIMQQNARAKNWGISLDLGSIMMLHCNHEQSFAFPIILEPMFTVIKSGDFANFSYLRSVKIPSEIVEIEPNSFKNCRFLTKVEILSKKTKVADDAFSLCPLLKEIYIEGQKIKVQDGLLRTGKKEQ